MFKVRDFDNVSLTRQTGEDNQGLLLCPDPPAEEAFYGLPGDIVRTIEPHTESDPVALLVQLLVAFGNVVGPGPRFRAEFDQHGINLFAVLVGASSKARKGTSWGYIRELFRRVDPEWTSKRISSGLSSGEGLVWAVRDPITKKQPITEKGRVVDYQEVEEDPGVTDKRLLVFEPEFGAALRVLTREGNILSHVIREAWETGDLTTLAKNSPAVATGAHISIVGHITKAELTRTLTILEATSGFAARFLWVCVKRSKLLPEGGQISEVEFARLADRLRRAVEFARDVRTLQRDEEARRVWCELYGFLSEPRPGLLGTVTNRAEAQVTRLASLYALLDLSTVVRREHLEAAIALWDYVDRSVSFIFGEMLGDPVVNRILGALQANPAGLTRTEIHKLFARHRSGKEIALALETLLKAKLVRRERDQGGNGGRPVERWFAVREQEEV